MPEIVFGVLVLALLLWAAQSFTRLDPHKLVWLVRLGGGVLAIAAALFTLARGELAIAVPLGLTGLGILGWLPSGVTGLFSSKPRARPTSRVRSAFVEMELDHETGAMGGRVLAGPHEGTTLDKLDVSTISDFLPNIDEESRALLMAYLDRRQPRWREYAKADADAGGSAAARGGKMTEQEAYQVLGVQPGASVEDIGRAHRTLIKKLHPDQGGSTYLAARVNEAKDVLLRRHR
jgi:hypothetical protein